MRNLFLIVLALGAAGWSDPVSAQQNGLTGAFRGQVIDESGAPIAGAQVVVLDEEAGTRRGAVAGGDGMYVVAQLPAGIYTLRVQALGYRTAERREQRLSAGEEVVIDFALATAPVALSGVEVVSATRTATPLSEIPSAVTVLTREQIREQATISNDLGDILTQTVPGLAPSTESLSNFGQTLRGRDLYVLIDGVPQSTPLRNVLRDLRTIDASAIERIEVVRGANAVYGYGGTGGVINIITRTPDPGRATFTTGVGGRLYTTHPDDSFSGNLSQQISGRTASFDYLLSGSFESRTGFFDAEGDRIPPDPHGQGGLAGSTEYNLLGKLGFDLNSEQRLQFTVNHYDHKQEAGFVTVPGVAGEQKTTTEPGKVPGENPGTENTVANFDYTHRDLFGSRLTAQLYYQDYLTRFGFGSFFPDGGGQSFLVSEKLGARLNVVTPFAAALDGTIAWGVDYLNDQTAQPLVDGRSWVPPIDQNAIAPFAQVKLAFGDRLLLRGGVRHEVVSLDVDDFTGLFSGEPVEGGMLDYNATLLNFGSVLSLTDELDLFGGFSQGFSVADVGRELRGTMASSVGQLNPEAQKVNGYDLGIRGTLRTVRASISGFYNESELGTTFSSFPELNIVRIPERVYGVESAVDIQPGTAWSLGGTLTWMEGKQDTDDDGDFDKYLPGYRIPPLKLTGYVEHQTLPGWRNRLQLLRSGSRDRFAGSDAFGEGVVESYTTVDLFSALDLWTGTLRVGVENLLNEQYFPLYSQVSNLGTSYTAGQGRAISVGYSVRY